MAKKSSKGIYFAAFALFVVGFGYLLFSGLSQDSVYFVNVSEALAIESGEGLNQARMFGVVLPQDLERHPGSMGVTFVLADKDDSNFSLRVNYKGVVPDTFKPGVEVIVEGAMQRPDNVFMANTLMTKCPSKYKKIREEEKGGA